jgi:PAS domain-containing protein
VGNLQKAMSGPGIITYHVEMIKKNREPIDLEINGIPLKKDGRLVGVLAILRDITERKSSSMYIQAQYPIKPFFLSVHL